MEGKQGTLGSAGPWGTDWKVPHAVHPGCTGAFSLPRQEQRLQGAAVLGGSGSLTAFQAPSSRQPAAGRGNWGRGRRARQEMGKAGVRPAEPWGRRRGAPGQPFLRAWNLRSSASRSPARVGAGRPGQGDLPAPRTPRGTQGRGDLQAVTLLHTHVPHATCAHDFNTRGSGG